MQHFLLYLLFSFRIFIGIIFSFSSIGKMRDVSVFQKTLVRFQVLPKKLIKPVALFIIIGEITVVFFMIIGESFLSIGFALATFLLLAFSTSLIFVLRKNISTTCNCFGADEKPISYYDVYRNGCFLLGTLGGWIISLAKDGGSETTNLAGLSLASILAVILAIILLNLQDIIQTFRMQ